MAGNIYYPNTVLLLHGNGVNAGTSFPDTSAIPKTISPGGNAQTSTAQSKFNGSSMLFDGAGDYLTSADSADWDFGVADFTLRLFIRPAATNDTELIAQRFTTEVNNFWFIRLTAAGKIRVYAKSSGAVVTDVIQSSAALSLNTWYHICIVRASGTVSIAIDGIFGTTSTTNLTTAWPNPTGTVPLLIGTGDNTYTPAYNGYMAELEIIKGVATNTSNFTPPIAPSVDGAYQLSGNITESSAITNWRVTATKCSDGTFVGTDLSGEAGTSYNIGSNTLSACNITLSPKIDYAWSAAKAAVLNDYVVAVNPDTTPHLWKCTTAGTTHATTEPTWILSGTTTDNTVTWTYVAPLVDPVTLGPKIPS